MPNTITVYDTLLESVAVETRRVMVSGGDPDVPPVYEDQTVRSLGRLSVHSKVNAVWVRIGFTLSQRLNPIEYGASNFEPGWVILHDVDVTPTETAGKKLSSTHDGGVVNLVDGTITYTWSLVDMTTEQLSAKLAETKSTMMADAAAKRYAVETSGIVRNGMAIATDHTTQSKLSGALQLVQADPSVVIKWKGTTWVDLDAAAVEYVAAEVGKHVQACFYREAVLSAAIDDVTTLDGLNSINIQAGSVSGSGSWPT